MKILVNFIKDKKHIINKIFLTLFIIFIYVIGLNIHIPCIPLNILEFAQLKKLILRDLSIFNSSMPIYFLSLGVMPYITASIIIQIASKIFSSLKEWHEQGSIGKYKINFITRLLTLIIAFGQGLASVMRSQLFDIAKQKILVLQVVFFLIVGSFICIWLSDLITNKGIGNGVSIFIVISISENLSKSFKSLLLNDSFFSTSQKILVLLSFLILLILTIILCSSYLKIPISYATYKQNDKIQNHIPLKINTSGILPIILANTFINIFPTIGAFLSADNYFKKFTIQLQESQYYYLGLGFFVYLLLILLFSFFSVFIMLDPYEIANNLSKQDAYLDGVKPGQETVYKITKELFKVTLMGAFSLTILAALPDIINFILFSKSNRLSTFNLGGTSLIIVVGVAIEIVQKITTSTNVNKLYNKLF
ncbi:MAG: preprotein translocase subunit SecY [Pigeon pea little leaf phytoplasma]|uniref:Protein translocase subunit SecY n=1 Tax=Candidatus Phytoplasma fabacearum TaxID=2982628 RepID=A0ABU8ZRV9_9MOLU|nr:preprotein translocase subunit SecY ['Bituminaria bituminosa' little leaf phytoplasma]MDV3148718.1 preprotein translocase subunit SecY [Pigeon pea little leaf phytoplasma]MDO7983407.1 preprotein translocase subunit SecY ['Bituminaria bituminosa' little leaf phytoplasma]MDO8023858.1 preprotein translocase subunit SecY ['Bituminaria bituminosa' little leaf phytoplasma]MDO8030604.1 preprotein translocase subunit SecY ['Bituminaria bituminosa' little leaf phytoplasma]MDV3153924.1 preprotein tra